jgi:iron(II)-dependent oxidoreductase
VLAANHQTSTAIALLKRLAEARSQSDSLFGLIDGDSFYERPIGERHRLVFYLGHLEAFDWNLLREPAAGIPSFHPELDQLFAFGIDPVGGGLPVDRPADWPSLAEIRRYNYRIRENLNARLPTFLHSDSRSEPATSPNILLNVAIEHRLMHAETLAYLLHQLPVRKKLRPRSAPPYQARPAAPLHTEMVEIPSGSVTLGNFSSSNGSFGWDNEYQAHSVQVPAFAIDKYKVTNGQYLAFVNDGGYQNRAPWSEADWNWRLQHAISHPAFWRPAGDRWVCRTMFDEVPLPLDWPAWVSHAEARAYARWSGKALPTEAQWQRAAFGNPAGGAPGGAAPPLPRPANYDFFSWDPVPVNAFATTPGPFGIVEMLGNGWEWTSSVFEPFPGFRPFPFYPGYSANFFDGRHFVLKGGSPRTAACMLRPSFRNWFQPHYPYVYAGFRCVSASHGETQ